MTSDDNKPRPATIAALNDEELIRHLCEQRGVFSQAEIDAICRGYQRGRAIVRERRRRELYGSTR